MTDDIDQEVKDALQAEEDYMGEQLEDMVDDPKRLKKLMQKGLDNVNKRYGLKKKD